MKNKIALFSIVALATLATACTGSSKGSSGKITAPDTPDSMGQDGDSSKRRGGIGDACEDTDGCAEGLACKRIGAERRGYCEKVIYDTEVTAKNCNIVECEQQWHCYDYDPACQDTYDACLEDPSSADCIDPPNECSIYSCENSKCERSCLIDDHCPLLGYPDFVCDVDSNTCVCDSNDDCPGTFICSGGACICNDDAQCDRDDPAVGALRGFVCYANEGVCGCNEDADCPANNVCRSKACVPSCEIDLECPLFHSCNNNQCVNDGCGSDRECAAFLDVDVSRVTCDDDKVCRLICSDDTDCGDDENYNFHRCVEGICQYVGCETANECDALLFQNYTPSEGERDALRARDVTCEQGGNVDYGSPERPDLDIDTADPNVGRCDGCSYPEGENGAPDPGR